MTRLRHSFFGEVRKMQMSSTSLYCFVEGITDPFIYGEICASVCDEEGISYEVVPSDLLPKAGSGKSVMKPFLANLRKRKLLFSDFKGIKTASVFFFDKDVDDLRRRMLRSPHVIYTEYYNLENYIFRHGDLARSLASCTSIDYQTIVKSIGGENQFKKQIAEIYRNWVVLCLFSCKYVRRSTNFGSHSHVNKDAYGAVDSSELTAYKTALQIRCGLSQSEFELRFAEVSKVVNELYATNNHDRYFNGKWYFHITEREISKIYSARSYEKNGLPSRLKTAMSYSLDINGRWSDHFKSKIRNVVKMLQ